MASAVTFCAYYAVQLTILMTSLSFRTVHSALTVTVVNITAYSATIRWELGIPQSSNLTGFSLTNSGDFAMNMIEDIHNVSSRMYSLPDLDDLRGYNACVATLVPAPEVPEVGCAQFSTPMGSTTSLAIVAGLFLLICLVTFAILDFVVSKSRNRVLAYKRTELLEQGWQTFQRHSKKKGKARKKKNASGRPISSAPYDEPDGEEPQPMDADLSNNI
ncbi:uncharacterized protein LOC117302754 [Asterias rubens]|uniref:uncharacterized protein LOC117302754 n=1 Tax=Asterias rubens TaxID=7604 RepID=UPI001455483F|nr:uncharacterized protein LOC117302754 [Asterias rubens]